MGLFNNFPYMDLSNLNLDFVLKKLKDLNNYVDSAAQDAETAVNAKDEAVAAKEAAQLSAENAASSEENAGQSAESAQNYAEHIADPVGGLVTGWLDDNITPTTPPVDASLTIQGAAADAKATGDAIDELSSEIENVSGVPLEVKSAMDVLFQKMAVKDDDSYLSEYTVIHAWATELSVFSISAVFTQGTATIFDDTPLNSLKTLLTVTATYSDNTTSEITDYALSGSLDSAISTVTVTYQGKTATFNVNVTLPVFDYNSVRDGLLSSVEGVTRSTDTESKWTESLTDENILRVRGTGSANNYLYYKIGDTPTTGKWRLVLNAQINQITTTGSQQALGLRPQISNGSQGVRFGFKPDGTVLANKSGTSLTSVGSINLGDIWHTIDARLDTSIPNQKIIIDGTTIMNISTLGTSATYNAVFFIASCIIHVRTIKLYDLSDAESE